MRLKFIILIFLSFLSVRVYSQIQASETEGCAPLNSVQFSTDYNNPQDINWDFGDATGSNLEDPQHTYINPGFYTVTFTATVSGQAVEESITIEVFTNPEALFESENGCINDEVDFADLSTGSGDGEIVDWEWTFGDGSSQNGIQNPSYNYSQVGTYDVGLIVTDENGCTDVFILQDFAISSPPTIDLDTDPSPMAACLPPLEVAYDLSASSNSPLSNELIFDWDFGNGNSTNLANPPSQTYTEQGSYNFSLTVTDDIGCSSTFEDIIAINNPDAEFTVEGAEDGIVCEDIVIENLTAFPPSFDYGDGFSGSAISHSYEEAGEYTLYMTVGQAGCFDTDSLTFTVEIPEFTIISDPSYVCSTPSTVDLQLEGNAEIQEVDWSWNDFIENIAGIGSNAEALVNYTELEPYQINGDLPLIYTADITTDNGCTATATHIDTLWEPNALMFADVTEGCAPLNVLFSDSSSADPNLPLIEWEWHVEDEVIINSDSSSVVHSFNEPGEYQPFLIVTNEAGCIDTSWAPTIYVGEELPVNFNMNPSPVCVGEEVTLEALGDLSNFDYFNFDADNSRWSACFLDNEQSYTFQNETGLQDVTITAVYNGCPSTFTQEFQVNGAIGYSSYDCNCETPLEYTFHADVQGASSWDWEFGDGDIEESSTEITVLHEYDDSGDYDLILVSHSDDGCPSFRDTLSIQVRQVEAVLNTDTLLCSGTEYVFDASQSVDNDFSCYSGYTVFWGDDSPPDWNSGGFFEHAYESSGDYTIQLAVYDVNGCRDTSEFPVQLFGISNDLSASAITGCLPLEVDFTGTVASDTTLVNFEWDFGDGFIENGLDLNNTHVFDFPVNEDPTGPLPWLVQFEATDTLGCSSLATIEILPIVPEVEIANISDPTICVGDEVSITPNPNLETWDYLWTINGNEFTETVPTVLFNEAGDYDISLSISDENGCPDDLVDPQSINVQEYPEAILSSTADELDVLCYPIQATFTNESNYNGADPGGISWELGNGSPVQPLNSVATTYDQPGTYFASLEVSTSNGCTANAFDTLEVVGPVAIMSLAPDEICKGESVSFTMSDTSDVWVWEWDFGDGVVANSENPIEHSYFFNPPGGTILPTLTVWSLDSVCSFSYQEELNIYEVIADFDRNGETFLTDTIHCDDITDLLTNTSTLADEFLWDLGNGDFFEGENPPIQDYTPGYYDITLYVENSELGCVDTITKGIQINPLPNPTATGGFICQGDLVELNAEGGETYLWSPDEGLSNNDIQNPLASPENTTTYTVTVTDENDCSASATAEVDVFLPLPSFELDSTVIIGESIDISLPPGLGGYTYEWQPVDWIDCSSCAAVTSTPEEDIIYSVLVSDTLGCFTTTYFVDIEVLPLSSVDVPDAFTPNNDGVNDIVYVEGWGIKELLTFEIYNRWGEQVFKTNDIEEGWNGYYKGQLQNMDTYTYIVRVETYIDSAPLELNGYLMLKR